MERIFQLVTKVLILTLLIDKVFQFHIILSQNKYLQFESSTMSYISKHSRQFQISEFHIYILTTRKYIYQNSTPHNNYGAGILYYPNPISLTLKGIQIRNHSRIVLTHTQTILRRSIGSKSLRTVWTITAIACTKDTYTQTKWGEA